MSEEEKKTTEEQVAPQETTEETTPEVNAEVAEGKTEEASSEEATEAPAEEQEEVVEELPYQDLQPGMVVRVHETIKDVNAKGEEKTRVQVFEGMLIGVKNPGVRRTITVRKNSKGFIVEKIYPLSSPNIEKIEVVKQFKVRRAKLTHLRGNFKRKLKEIEVKN